MPESPVRVADLSFLWDLPVARTAVEFDRSVAEAKLDRQRRSLAMLDEALPGSRVVEMLRFEIEALERLPPADGERVPDPA